MIERVGLYARVFVTTRVVSALRCPVWLGQLAQVLVLGLLVILILLLLLLLGCLLLVLLSVLGHCRRRR
jgi:hypothetical protein